MKPEQMDHGSKEQYSGFEGADTPFSEPVYVDAEVKTNLTASDIDVMADCKEKLENKTQLKGFFLLRISAKTIRQSGFTLAFHHWIAYLWCSTFQNQLLRK